MRKKIPDLAMHRSPRCTAHSKRTGNPCKNPAVKGYRVCRMHGARGGAPSGKKNGNYRYGNRTTQAKRLGSYWCDGQTLLRRLYKQKSPREFLPRACDKTRFEVASMPTFVPDLDNVAASTPPVKNDLRFTTVFPTPHYNPVSLHSGYFRIA